jgi:hypothetical protein
LLWYLILGMKSIPLFVCSVSLVHGCAPTLPICCFSCMLFLTPEALQPSCDSSWRVILFPSSRVFTIERGSGCGEGADGAGEDGSWCGEHGCLCCE